jgi:hypothetical protein
MGAIARLGGEMQIRHDEAMPLSSEAIREFQAIYRQEFGVELSEAETEAMAPALLQLFTLARPLPRAHARTCPLHHTPPSSPPAD